MVLCYLVFLILSFSLMSGHVFEPYRRIPHRTGDSNNNIRVESLPIHLFVVVKLSPNTIQAMYDGVFFGPKRFFLFVDCVVFIYMIRIGHRHVCVHVKMPLEMGKTIRMGSTAAPMRIIRENRTQTLSNYIYIRKCNTCFLNEANQMKRKKWKIYRESNELLCCYSLVRLQNFSNKNQLTLTAFEDISNDKGDNRCAWHVFFSNSNAKENLSILEIDLVV